MCDPVSITAAVTIASAAMAANAQRQQGKFQQGTADYNARVAENEAQSVRNAGVESENDQRSKTAALLSRQRAQLGASGVDVGSGSALQIQEDTETLGEADALRIRGNFEERAKALETGGSLTRSQGAFARKAGNDKAFGTLIGGAAKASGTGVADKWFTPTSSLTLA